MVLAIRSQIDFSGSSGRASNRRVHTTVTPGGKEVKGGIVNKLRCFLKNIMTFLFILPLTLICS